MLFFFTFSNSNLMFAYSHSHNKTWWRTWATMINGKLGWTMYNQVEDHLSSFFLVLTWQSLQVASLDQIWNFWMNWENRASLRSSSKIQEHDEQQQQLQRATVKLCLRHFVCSESVAEDWGGIRIFSPIRIPISRFHSCKWICSSLGGFSDAVVKLLGLRVDK